MKAPIIYVLTQLLVLLFSWSLVFAQEEMPPHRHPPQQETPQQDTSIPPPQQNVPRQSRPAFTQQELDQMLAPIALYPDSLLSQILMASTYPLRLSRPRVGPKPIRILRATRRCRRLLRIRGTPASNLSSHFHKSS